MPHDSIGILGRYLVAAAERPGTVGAFGAFKGRHPPPGTGKNPFARP
jgi:hypothetical protein